MTVGVDDELRIREYPGDDSATPRPVPFKFLGNDDLKVTRVAADGSETVLVRGTDYSVAGAGSDAGGSVTPLAPIASGTSWRIEGDMPLAQPTDYTAGDDFPAESHERGLDRSMIAHQEARRDIEDTRQRALTVPRGEVAPPLDVAGLTDGDLLTFRDGRLARLDRERFAGAFFAGDPTGKPIPASGTGADGALRSDLGNHGDEIVAALQGGDNAVARTVRSELRDLSISPMQFGALANVIANDRVPVQRAAAFAKLVGRRLDLMGKTYICNGQSVSVECSVDGRGAKIFGRIQVDASHVQLRDIDIESDLSAYGVYVRGTSGARLSDIVLDNVRVKLGSGTTEAERMGIDAKFVDRLTISGGFVSYGIQLASCAGYQMIGVHVDGEYKNVNELLHASVNSWGLVTGCTFTRSKDNFIDLYSSGARTVITGNRFVGCQCRIGTAIEIKISFSDNPDNTSGDALGYAEQVIISDNYFGDIAFTAANTTSVISIYHFDDRASPPPFTWADAPRNIKIADNIFDGFDGANQGAALMMGIYAYRCVALDIHGNMFRNFNKGGSGSDFSSLVWLEDCKDVSLIGNRGSLKDGCSLSFHGACDNITSQGNQWTTDQKTGFSNKYGVCIQKVGTRADPTLTRASFSGDKIYGTLNAFRQTYHAAALMTDVTFMACDFLEYSIFSRFTRCKWIGNDFRATSGKDAAAAVGSLNAISSFITWTGNTTHSTSNPGALLYRVRIGNINGNQAFGATAGIYFFGTSAAGELDHLNVKDNFSFAQSHADFPRSSNVHATDSGTHQLANNQKVAA